MKNIDKYGKYSGILSLVEIGLGSFLHGLKIPFSGMFLSLNQIFILNLASRDINEKSAPGVISTTSAILKTLAPAGKKLTPMLAICAQGHLFGFGLICFGNNLVGRIFGAILSALWAFVQPITIYYILYGKDFYFMLEYFSKTFSKVFENVEVNFIEILIGIVVFKIVLAVFITILAKNLPMSLIQRYFSWGKSQYQVKEKKISSPFKGAIKDTFHPLFILSIILMGIFYYFSKDSSATIIWKIIRPLAIAFCIFYGLRIFPIENLINKLKDGKYKETLKAAIDYVKS